MTGSNWPECVGTAATAFEVFTLNVQVVLCKMEEIKHDASYHD